MMTRMYTVNNCDNISCDTVLLMCCNMVASIHSKAVAF